MPAGDMHWISEFLTMSGFVLMSITAIVSLVLVVLLEEDNYKQKWAPQFVYTYYFELLRNPRDYLTEQGIKLLSVHKKFLLWGTAATLLLFVLGSVETVYAGIQS